MTCWRIFATGFSSTIDGCQSGCDSILPIFSVLTFSPFLR